MKCLCATTRRAARSLTLYYENMLRPSGLTVAQFELMANLFHQPGLSQRRLAELLRTDQTTLSRNLRVLDAKGWVVVRGSDDDKRVSLYELTDTGRATWRSALPHWERAQAQMQKALGRDWDRVFEDLARLSASAAAPNQA